METARKVAAAIIGVLVIILLVLFARWLGEQIRDRYFAPKPTVTVKQIIPPEVGEIPVRPSGTVVTQAGTGATMVRTIPSTGPNDFGYFLIGLAFISGLVTLRLASRDHLS